MGLFDAISDLITGSVGNNMDNNEDDVLKVKQNLHKAGYFDAFNEEPEPHGFITKNFANSIQSYQKDNGLKVDGILHPRGETERGLIQAIMGQNLEPLFGETDDFDEGTVGFGGNVSGTFGTNPFGRKNSFDDVALYAVSQTNKGEPAQPVSAPPASPSKPEATEAPPVNLITAQVGKIDMNESQSSQITQSKNKEETKVPEEGFLTKATDWGFSVLGLDKGQKLFDHYVDGSGKPVILSAEDINKSPLFSGAIKENRRRFEDSMTKGEVGNTKSDFNKKILELKDGESITLDNPNVPEKGDHWDEDLSPADLIKNADINQYMATGHVKLRSSGAIQATRKGDTIKIEGVVDHSINDLYDFNEDDTIYYPYKKMADEGNAEPFRVQGSSKENITGELTVKDGRITDQRFKWNKADP